MGPKEPPEDEADVISLDDARHKKEAASGGEAEIPPPQSQPPPATVALDGNEFLKPVMAAIARELANVADPDGVVRVGGTDEASRAKTAAVVKGLGIGLGQALAEAFGKYAQKIEEGQAQPPLSGTITTTAPADGDDDKQPS